MSGIKTPGQIVDELLSTHPIQTADGWGIDSIIKLAEDAIEADRRQRVALHCDEGTSQELTDVFGRIATLAERLKHARSA